MALDFNAMMQILNGAGQLYNTLNNSVSSNGGNLGQSALGIGSMLAGANQKEPGEVTEARQFLRNQFTSPNALTDQFTGQLGALNSEFQPYLDQQANRLLDETQQRYIAGLPSSLSPAMGGSEIGAIRDTTVNQILPGQRAFLGTLGLDLLGRQTSAAQNILDTNKGNPLADALGQIGALMLYNGLGMGGGGTGGLNLGSATGQQGQGNAGGILQSLGSLLGLGGATASGGSAAGAAGGGLGGILSGVGGALQSAAPVALPLAAAAGAAKGGYEWGKQNEDLNNLPNAAKAALTLGTMGLAAWPLFGAYNQEKAIKAENRANDVAAQTSQTTAARDFFAPLLQQSGFNLDAPISPDLARRIVTITGSNAAATPLYGSTEGRFSGQGLINFLSGKSLSQVGEWLAQNTPNEGDQQSMMAGIYGAALLSQAQAQDPNIASLDDIPGMRDQFMSYLTQNNVSGASNLVSAGLGR
jgi:hypothetical protein